jgi:hypothetical protein
MTTESVIEEDPDEFATYYIVITDTGLNYDILLNRMLELNQVLSISIDSMGRQYNPKKNLIAMPDDSEDDIYAGEYYPRRFPSEELSIEYLSMYRNNAGEKTMALVAGIFESKEKADSTINHLKKYAPYSFITHTKMFIGCLH